MEEQPPDYYDKLYRTDDTVCPKYIKLWKTLSKHLSGLGVKSVLDAGCGLGGFAAVLNSNIEYSGFDFSEVAVAKCTSKGLNVWCGNAADISNYGKYDAYIATEVLEHITDDLNVVRNVPPSALFCFSVPTFKHESHVRHFKAERKIKLRYSKLVDIYQIIKFKNRFLCFGRRFA